MVDHGKIYLSEHLMSACARLGISVQPARRLPGHRQGPPWNAGSGPSASSCWPRCPATRDRTSTGAARTPSSEAFYFLDELEQVIRRWTAECYHRQPHSGLCVPEVPGLEVSPLEMFAHGIARAGYLQVPARADLALDFLARSSGAPSSTTGWRSAACATTARR